MKTLKTIGIIFIGIVALVLIIGLFLPGSLHMEQSVLIDKPAKTIFKQVNDFRNWTAWSPFQANDSSMVSEYSGNETGIGSKTTWISPKYGDGSMKIVESVPYTRIVMKLEMMEGDSTTTTFEFDETGDSTRVVWSVDLDRLGYPLGRYLALFMPGMMNPILSQGLDSLRKQSENLPDPPRLKIVDLEQITAITILDSCSWSEMGSKMSEMYGELMATIFSFNKLKQTGPPFAIYHAWDETGQTAVFETGIPVNLEVKPAGRVEYRVLPATRALMGEYYGPYEGSGYMYQAMDEFIKEFSLETTGGPMEVYIVDPSAEPDTSKWQTNIYFPVK